MKFIPVLFSTPMVQSLNDKRKKMTRRVMKIQPKDDGQNWKISRMIESTSREDRKHEGKLHWVTMENEFSIKDYDSRYFQCPYGQPGDVLWVRETWQFVDFAGDDNGFVYKATDPDWETMEGWKWRPSLFMPKAACRIFLKITKVRVERLQDISEQDAIDEGVERSACGNHFVYYSSKKNMSYVKAASAYTSFCSLWQSINGLDSWNKNPFVWVIEFEQIEKPAGFQ